MPHLSSTIILCPAAATMLAVESGDPTYHAIAADIAAAEDYAAFVLRHADALRAAYRFAEGLK